MEAVKVKRPSLREQQKAASRERLVDAAVEVFSEVGFRNATIDQIVNAAGAARATFYLYFKDKTAVAAAIGRRLTPRVRTSYEALAALRDPTVQSLEKWVASYRMNSPSGSLEAQMVSEALAWDPAFVSEYHGYLEHLADTVMAEAMARVPTKRRPLVRSKFIMICLMLDRYLSVTVRSEEGFLGGNAEKAIAEILKRELFDEQAS
ncbi:TetR/AcrR family transcriptional regulator [Paraburkholderia phytofirmans]|uniref:TetR/AcrR family transcriptional regulator n=1 Tax=Paraburkholderia phytofirmans TaxID=261302 RepID=UPI0038B777D0